MGTFPAYAARTGPYRVVAAKLPPDHAQLLRAYASRTGQPIQAILKALVADWVKVNQPINLSGPPAAPVAAPPIAAIPATQRARESTGKAEPDRVLQAIDEARGTAGKARRD